MKKVESPLFKNKAEKVDSIGKLKRIPKNLTLIAKVLHPV
jgi:hypothetical protein